MLWRDGLAAGRGDRRARGDRGAGFHDRRAAGLDRSRRRPGLPAHDPELSDEHIPAAWHRPGALRGRQERALSAAEEMKIVLAKTAYSPLLKSAGDYSCGVFDARGEMVAQGPDLPIHLGSMPDAVAQSWRGLRLGRARGRRFHPQRSLFRRQPSAGRQRGEARLPRRPCCSAIACLRAHWPDIGSATPGSYGAVTEIYGEGLRLPPLRLYRDGKPRPGRRGHHPGQCAHAGRTPGRPARAGRGQPPRRAAHGRAGGEIRHGGAAAHHGCGPRLFRGDDAPGAADAAGWRGGIRGFLDGDGVLER